MLAGGVPHHSFAVFCIYPWTGLLSDGRKAPHALTVLDRCRIRWGKVLAVQGDQVVVESRPLTWDGHTLDLGEPEKETAVRSLDGVGMVGRPRVGGLGLPALGVGVRPADRATGAPLPVLHDAAPARSSTKATFTPARRVCWTADPANHRAARTL